MFRFAWWTLRQRRYASLITLMVFLAAGCVTAGVWQVHRFESKVHANDTLRANYRAPQAQFEDLAVPLSSLGRASTDALRFRPVTVTGTYDPGAQQYLDNQSDANGDNGFYVLTPLRTAGGTLLVVRGFLAAGPDGLPTTPTAATAAPAGTVRLSGRLEAVSTSTDHAGRHSVVTTVNPTRQAARLGTAVYDTELQLDAGQPGTAGLAAIPAPDLSNPAGGAYDWQHFAYVVQWFLFALLALAAPFALGRFELRDARRRFLGLDDEAGDFGDDPGEFDAAVTGSRAALTAGGAGAGAELSVRAAAELTVAHQEAIVRLQRAEVLADRYGRSLGTGLGLTGKLTRRPRRSSLPAGQPYQLPDSSAQGPRRSPDDYHGSYNDYLWELAMADGDLPQPDKDTGPTDTGLEEPRELKILPPAE